MKRSDLPELLKKTLENINGQGTIIDVCREFYKEFGDDLRSSGDLFYTWQYDIRWAASTLRKAGLLDDSSKGIWKLKNHSKPSIPQSGLSTTAQSIPNTSIGDSKYWSINATLGAIGKKTFIVFYEDFLKFYNKKINKEELLKTIKENSSKSGKQDFVIPRAMHIFANNQQLDALKIICDSKKVDQQYRDKAKLLLEKASSTTPANNFSVNVNKNDTIVYDIDIDNLQNVIELLEEEYEWEPIFTEPDADDCCINVRAYRFVFPELHESVRTGDFWKGDEPLGAEATVIYAEEETDINNMKDSYTYGITEHIILIGKGVTKFNLDLGGVIDPNDFAALLN